MTSFWFQVWRLAFANARYEAIGGWRRLWWRFWWLVDTKPLPGPEVRVLAPPKRPAILHWSPGDTGKPMCGATVREPWTREFQYTTCEKCKSMGSGLHLHYDVNTR